MKLTRVPMAALAARHAGGLDVMKSLANDEKTQSVAAIVVICMYGSDESLVSAPSLLEVHPVLGTKLVDLLSATVHGESFGSHPFGAFPLNLVLSAVSRLLASSSNKCIIIDDCSRLLDLLAVVLGLYVRSSPPIGPHGHDQASSYSGNAGGGADDMESASLAIEALCRLSFCYDQGSEQLHRVLAVTSLGTDLSGLLLALIDKERVTPKLDRESVSSAVWLRQRLRVSWEAAAGASSVDQTHRSGPRPGPSELTHVMISYARSHRQEYVVMLTRLLKEQGIDVWRDEEGPNIAGPSERHSDDRDRDGGHDSVSETVPVTVSEAVDRSSAAIVCVSRQYVDSVSCRQEALYIRHRYESGNLDRIVYVMLDEDCTPSRSSRHPLRLWMTCQIGTLSWYRLWHVDQLQDTASKIASNLRGGGLVASTSAGAGGAPPSRGCLPGGEPTENDPRGLADAWALLRDPGHTRDFGSLSAYLNDLGVTDASHLGECSVDNLMVMRSKLKEVPARRFDALVGTTQPSPSSSSIFDDCVIA
jgi:TIR domain